MQLPNPITKPWFKPKSIGWGWVPANYKGWLVLLAMLIFVFVNIIANTLIREKTDIILSKFDDLSWMIIFYSTIQLIINFILAFAAVLTITRLTSSTK